MQLYRQHRSAARRVPPNGYHQLGMGLKPALCFSALCDAHGAKQPPAQRAADANTRCLEGMPTKAAPVLVLVVRTKL